MALNNNIFCVSNPARMADALWQVMTADGGADNIADMLIFLPSRRAVRSVEKMIAEKKGGAAILPRLVALGEGADDALLGVGDDADIPDDVCAADDVASDTLRRCVLAKLLAADANIRNISVALPVARDLIRMTDYLENEGIDIADVDWGALVDSRYATHFQSKARMLEILARVMPMCGGVTQTARRNAGICAWIDVINKGNFSRVIVCSSTASVPATADLMAAIAGMPYGRIILPGKIAGREEDLLRDTHPYNCEYKFLSRIGVAPDAVRCIDVGSSNIDFFNTAFGNVIVGEPCELSNCHLVECPREATEAAAAAEIAVQAAVAGKSVLIITPDAAANQRLRTEFAARDIVADFSGGISGAQVPAGRAILNLLDDWILAGNDTFNRLIAAADGNLFQMFSDLIESGAYDLRPDFDIDDDASRAVWGALAELSDCLQHANIMPTVRDARAFIADTLSGVVVRPIAPDNAHISVIGTIESRMQTADVVILMGLNDGMFPARGYENAWLPRAVARDIGLPPGDRKVALMSLDFMNLSCGKCVYWLRSKVSGSAQTTESRFLSRVAAHGGRVDVNAGAHVLDIIAARDNPPAHPLNSGVACPPADWSDVYVTELELLIHNPYAFYARHILKLRPLDDWWVGPDARTFGNLVHSVIENARDFSPDVLVREMDAQARAIVGTDSVLYHFWHRRFTEIAPVVCDVLAKNSGRAEIGGSVKIPVGNGARTVRARADRVCNWGVIDIKTGAVPSKKQLIEGNMPQLPLEAYMQATGGFGAAMQNPMPEIMFLQLRGGDVRAITYDAPTTAQMIAAAVDKVTGLFNQYTAGGAEYEYRATTDQKYRAYDDLARADD